MQKRIAVRQGTADSNGRFNYGFGAGAHGNFNRYGGYYGGYGYSGNIWNDLFFGGMWGFGAGAHGSNNGQEADPEYYDIDNIYPLYANGEAVATYEEDLVYSPSVTYWTGWGGFFGGYYTTKQSNYATYTETNYFASDTLGTVRVATGNNGSVIGYADYDVFGNPYERAGTLAGDDLMYAYTCKTWDAVTGLSNYGFRDYAPQLARFTTVDPIRDGSNWYAYVHNDPVNLRDLWGLCSESDNNTGNYTIKSGDTLSQITQNHNNKYGTNYSVEDIAAHNGIANPDLIYAGSSLNLPVPTPCPYDFYGSGSGPGISFGSQSSPQNSGLVITIGVSANLVFGVGGDASVGLQFDTGNPSNSGIVTSAGFAAGASIGVGVFANWTASSSGKNILTGSTGILLSPISVAGGVSENGDLSISAGYGAGFGFYTSIEHSSFTSFSDFTETFVESLSTMNLPN
ncbi:MAG: LysM peptidoglycan-binding domain-containing protein [Treponema sp.]|nr:LysM peptidoglycan-binding domain-containing protein [Candidatus Treponema caballi]